MQRPDMTGSFAGRRMLGGLVLVGLLAGGLRTQGDDAPPTPAEELLSNSESLAFVDVDVYTGDGKRLARVDVLVEGGKFTTIGKDLEIPPSFRRIEGGCLTPGLVLVGSTASLAPHSRPQRPRVIEIRGRRRRFRPPTSRRSSRATYTPNVKVSSKLKPQSEDWAKLLKGGITTHGVRPVETGLSGLGAAVRPLGRKVEDMVLADEKFLWLGMAANTATKKLLRENFEKAKQMLEARKKAKEVAKKPPVAEGKPETKAAKEAPKKETPTKEPPKKEPPEKEPPKKSDQEKKAAGKAEAAAKKPAKPKEDPRTAILAKVLEKKLPLLVGVSGAGEMLHVLEALRDTEFPLTILHAFARGASDTLDHLSKQLKARRATVVLPVEFGYLPHSQHYSNPVANLQRAGIPVVLLPGAGEQDMKTLWWRMSEMARAGGDCAKLVQSLTLEPAKLLGVDKRVGSIAKGKDANLLHFSRDPFSPASRLLHVYFEGRTVEALATRH